MKPPDQPNPIETREVLQRVLVIAVRQKLQHVARLAIALGRLMPRMKFQRLLR
jgi:hypothetical protein